MFLTDLRVILDELTKSIATINKKNAKILTYSVEKISCFSFGTSSSVV